MGELTGADVAAYTGGRLADNTATQDMLKAALVTARRYAGWHVCPVRPHDEVTVDGPDSRQLVLPSRKLVTLHEVSESAVDVPVNTLSYTNGSIPGLGRAVTVRKAGGAYWTDEYAAIVVDMTHGYTEDEAADWRRAVLSMVDQIAMSSAGGVSDANLKSIRVDDVSYGYQTFMDAAADLLFSMSAVFDDYRLPPVDFI